jgi:hypothetical protein
VAKADRLICLTAGLKACSTLCFIEIRAGARLFFCGDFPAAMEGFFFADDSVIILHTIL